MLSNLKPRILIVDDYPANVTLLSSILERLDCEIIEAFSGKEALRKTIEYSPSLMLLDIMMPEMDGFEVCKRLKKIKVETPGVIFISAKSGTDDKVSGFSYGALDYISKPFDSDEVLARVKTHLELQETRIRLKESERKYSTLINNVQDGIFLWLPEDKIIFSNPSFQRMIDFSKREILNFKLPDIFIREDIDKARTAFESVYSNKTLSTGQELKLGIKNKSGKTVYVGCLPGYIIFQNSPSVLITLRDLTERITLEKQLVHKQKMEALGTLTAGIAHDFNNMLALINGYSELAMLDLDKTSPAYEKLQIIHNAGKNAVTLTKGLLSFGRKKDLVLEV